MFRFQTGSIKRKTENEIFNETIMFRFQTGSIKSPPRSVATGKLIVFRFQTGSIKRISEDFFHRVNEINVSIPNWFD